MEDCDAADAADAADTGVAVAVAVNAGDVSSANVSADAPSATESKVSNPKFAALLFWVFMFVEENDAIGNVVSFGNWVIVLCISGVIIAFENAVIFQAANDNAAGGSIGVDITRAITGTLWLDACSGTTCAITT